MASSSGATCCSSSGVTTARGRCRRQSVASVAWATRVKGSKRTLCAPAMAASSRLMRLRSSGVSSTSVRKAAIRARHWARIVEHARIAFGLGGDGLQVLGGIFKEALAARSRGDQLLKQVGIAAMNQHLAEQAHEEARGAAGNASAAQLVEGANGLWPKQERHRLAVIGGGVVERDLAGAGSRAACLLAGLSINAMVQSSKSELR